MKPEIWGKPLWVSFHLITVAYPENPTEKDKNHYYVYINSLKYVLPCDKCKKNLKDHLKKYPLTRKVLSCRTNLVRWGIDLHNVVNYYTGKPLLTYVDALNEINNLINPIEIQTSRNSIFYLFLALLLIMIMGGAAFGLFYYKKN
jgi:hypothetical protein